MICRYNDRRNKNCIVKYYLNNTRRIIFCFANINSLLKKKKTFGLDKFLYTRQCINKVKLLFRFLTTKKRQYLTYFYAKKKIPTIIFYDYFVLSIYNSM